LGSFTFDGHKVPFQEGDTLGAALHRSGRKVLARSLKYHRPRGLYCNQGSCGSCLVDADGVPNTPACMAPCRDGGKVLSQNRLGSARHDLYGVTDKVFWEGFDPHNLFTSPRALNEAFLRAVRFMSGLGKAPKPGTAPAIPGPQRHTLRVDELVVGAGRNGLARAAEAAKAGSNVLLVEEARALGGSARWHPLEGATKASAAALGQHPTLTAWTDAVCFGLYPAEGDGHVAAIQRPGPDGLDLWEVRARRITLATGHHDAWPLFTNNDLPGVLSLRGALRLLGEHHVRPGWRVVVHGPRVAPAITAWFQNAGIQVAAHGTVSEARGGVQVEAAKVDGDWVDCDTIVCNVAPVPRVELFQQAGCKLSAASGALAPVVGPDGSTSVPGVFAALHREVHL
jgi:sarcosine oxidase subunit alpha